MNHIDNFSGQRIDYRERNDNAPARYSAPSACFKKVLASHANPYCQRCSGTGYLGRYNHVCAGRCFRCIPENIWEHAREQYSQTSEVRTGIDEMGEIYLAVCSDDSGGPAYLSDGTWLTRDGQIFDAADSNGQRGIDRGAAFRPACLTA